MSIDLNADVGEGMAGDEALIGLISSASIACGGHAGDRDSMARTILLAKAAGVAIGAHPGFEDKANFGRRRLDLSSTEIAASVIWQIAALEEVAAGAGAEVRFVKLHGALANMAAEDFSLAYSVFEAAAAHNPKLAILALAGSQQVVAAEKLGLKVVREAYADRAYLANGLLASRGTDGAVLEDVDQIVAQCLKLAVNGAVKTTEGGLLKTGATSICIHGDNPEAVAAARAIRAAFDEHGIAVKSAFQ